MPDAPHRLRRLAPLARQTATARLTRQGRARGSITIEVRHGGCAALNTDDPGTVLGHSLNRARRRYLNHAEWIVAMDDRRLVGVAAYHPIQSDVRLVLEFLLDPTLSESDAGHVTNMLLSTVERLACESGAQCLMVMLDRSATLRPFDRRGYRTIAVDATCAWMQKCLVPAERPSVRARRIH
jgi:hypothetical protein